MRQRPVPRQQMPPQQYRRPRKKSLPLLEKALIFATSFGVAVMIGVFAQQWFGSFRKEFLFKENWQMLIFVIVAAWVIMTVLKYLLKMQWRVLTR
ncbi:MAG: hypothetical protein GOV15_04100 [Candidatus Diapherotrites archaeon]|nr:hypothetical protein [Candidatus Diapherotrites archaeon]